MNKRLIRIIAAAVLFVAAVLIPVEVWWLKLIIFLVPYLTVGYDVLIEAVTNIFHGSVFDENFLMAIATIGAFAIGEYPEAVGVMLFYQIGELFQSYAVNKSRRSIKELLNLRPDSACVIRNGQELTVSPSEVSVGEIVRVRPGEKIPLDGVVTVGTTTVDTSALTGESMPRECREGSDIQNGCINLTGLVEIEVTKPFGESTVSKIMNLVENAGNKKSKSENFIAKFAAVYTPAVVITAAVMAVLPPLLISGQSFADWIYRALSFLVVSCPCALVISIPLSFFGGIGGASRQGILVKGSNYLEAIAKADTVIFDKTGTLTKGVFEVTQIIPAEGYTEKEVIEYTALAEIFSNHPISVSIRKAWDGDAASHKVEDVKEIAGEGVSAIADGRKILAGNIKLMKAEGISVPETKATGTVVFTAVDGKYVGCVIVSDSLKADSVKAISGLKDAGIKKTVMLTGDTHKVGKETANALGVDEFHTDLMPWDKVDKVEEIIENRANSAKVVFVGDGINDAPVLARSDIGVAMGGLGSEAAIEAADIVIMTDEPSKVVSAIKIARKTLRICHQNIVFALGVKLLVLVLVAMGLSNMWEAVFSDVGVAVIAILNAMRAMKAE